MIAERFCPTHGYPLLDLTCVEQHGWTYDKHRIRTGPNFEVEQWLLVIDGIVAATCDVTGRTRWLRTPSDGGYRKLADRTVDGIGGRAWSMDQQYERRQKNQGECKRRQLERERAKREGREPAAWAALRRVEEAEA